VKRTSLAISLILLAATAVRARDSAGDSLTDRPEPFSPVSPRSEEDEDRIRATTLIIQGQILERRGCPEEALPAFQRAYRYAPDGSLVLRDIVSLAFRLKRNATAARYAVLQAEQAPIDADLVTRVAEYLAQQPDYPRALKLYLQAREMREADPLNADWVRLHYELGRLQFLTKDYVNSANSFALVRDALDDPKIFEAEAKDFASLIEKPQMTYSLFAEAFLEAGRYDEAAAMIRKAFEAKPDAAMFALQMARIDQRRGKVAPAIKRLNDYFAAKSSAAGSEPYILLRKLLESKHTTEDQAQSALESRLKQLHQEDPDNAALGYFLARLLIDAGDLSEAEQILAPLAKDEPTLDAYEGLLEIYRRGSNTKELLALLGDIASQVGGLEQLGEQATALTADADLVGRLIETAERWRKETPESLTNDIALGVAMVAVAGGRFDDAEQFFQLALNDNLAERGDVLTNWALEMFFAEEYDRAGKVFQRIIDDKVRPEATALLYFYLAGALEMAGKTDEAIRAARKAAELDPSTRNKSRVGWVLYHAKRFAEAEKEYLKLIEEYDSKHDSIEIREFLRETRLVLSNLCVEQDRLDEAEEWLEQILDEYPEDIGAMNDLGYLWADQGKRLERSLNMIKAAVADQPQNMAYLDSLGWAYYRLGRYAEAVEQLEKAASEEESDGVIHDHLGDAYLKNNQKDKAIAAWQKAVDTFQKDNRRGEMKKTQTKIKQHKD
jgi:tetratricopeptide (TPR) repeat protein